MLFLFTFYWRFHRRKQIDFLKSKSFTLQLKFLIFYLVFNYIHRIWVLVQHIIMIFLTFSAKIIILNIHVLSLRLCCIGFNTYIRLYFKFIFIILNSIQMSILSLIMPLIEQLKDKFTLIIFISEKSSFFWRCLIFSQLFF